MKSNYYTHVKTGAVYKLVAKTGFVGLGDGLGFDSYVLYLRGVDDDEEMVTDPQMLGTIFKESTEYERNDFVWEKGIRRRVLAGETVIVRSSRGKVEDFVIKEFVGFGAVVLWELGDGGKIKHGFLSEFFLKDRDVKEM